MKLPDFLEFEPFNDIRDRMGADVLGDFVFFDPHLNLTGHERLSLEQEGLPIDDEHFRIGADFTLIYKDSRILLTYMQPESQEVDRAEPNSPLYYHIASCNEVEVLMKEGLKESRWVGRTTISSGEQETCQVCTECLQRMQYQHFDNHRHRHRGYSDRVQQDFDLADFFRRYPMYPVGAEISAPIF